MKSTGIVRHLDPLGRITLPKEMRDTRNIGAGDPVEIFVDGDQIILKKCQKHSCALCGNTKDLYITEHSKLVCEECVTSFIDAKAANVS